MMWLIIEFSNTNDVRLAKTVAKISENIIKQFLVALMFSVPRFGTTSSKFYYTGRMFIFKQMQNMHK